MSQEQDRDSRGVGKVIDCDVHATYRSTSELLPYLDEPFKGWVAESGIATAVHGYRNPIGTARRDARPPRGGSEGSDPEFIYEQLLRPYNIEYAVLIHASLLRMGIHPDVGYAAAICSAYNDWLIEHWLNPYPEFKGAILIAPQDPQSAVREIERLGDHPDMVEVVMTSAARSPYGQSLYHPIYEAAERKGLPIAIHPGAEGSGIGSAPTAVGHPSYYIEWHTNLAQGYMTHLVSLICEGVFEKFPTLKFVLVEGGVCWLAPLLWRLDKNYKALRVQVPWVKRMPSEYVKDHIRLTTQPIEEPPNRQHLLQLFEMIDAKEILLFSSDYPHWDFDSPTAALPPLPTEMKHRILYQNAKELYSL